MSEKIKSEMISRRRAFSLLGLAVEPQQVVLGEAEAADGWV